MQTLHEMHSLAFSAHMSLATNDKKQKKRKSNNTIVLVKFHWITSISFPQWCRYRERCSPAAIRPACITEKQLTACNRIFPFCIYLKDCVYRIHVAGAMCALYSLKEQTSPSRTQPCATVHRHTSKCGELTVVYVSRSFRCFVCVQKRHTCLFMYGWE